MANEEQLAILKQGVEVWNKWRDENPDIKVDLRNAALDGLNLSLVNLNGAFLTDTDFSNSSLAKADLSNAHLIRTNFAGADLTGVNLSHSFNNFTELTYTKLLRANFKGATLLEARFGHTMLNDSKNLETCTHASPSILDLPTLDFWIWVFTHPRPETDTQRLKQADDPIPASCLPE